MRIAPSHALAIIALLVGVASAPPAAAQVAQVDTGLGLSTSPTARNRVRVPIEQGSATVEITARNIPDAVVVDLFFRYVVPPDTIALDELVERIEVATETPDGKPFFAAAIDAQLIPLNPNRIPLFYRVTLQRPTEGIGYRVRAKVFGNYE
jgi:hypothetical protein